MAKLAKNYSKPVLVETIPLKISIKPKIITRIILTKLEAIATLNRDYLKWREMPIPKEKEVKYQKQDKSFKRKADCRTI